jgi:hypothetical protein
LGFGPVFSLQSRQKPNSGALLRGQGSWQNRIARIRHIELSGNLSLTLIHSTMIYPLFVSGLFQVFGQRVFALREKLSLKDALSYPANQSNLSSLQSLT